MREAGMRPPPRPARRSEGRAGQGSRAARTRIPSHPLLPSLINLTEVAEPPGNKLTSDSTGGPVSNERGSGLKITLFFFNIIFFFPPLAALE